MTTIEESATADSIMEYDDTSQTRGKPRCLSSAADPLRRRKNGDPNGDGEECNAEAWQTLSKGFKDVQSVLDQNRGLIQQVNANQQSKIPDNMAKNVALIREINGNISKVMGMYSHLSANFTDIVQQRRSITNDNSDSKEESPESL